MGAASIKIQPVASASACPPGVALWWWDLDLDEADPSWAEPFSLAERERWSRFRFPRDALRYLRAHHGLRVALSDLMGVSPTAIQLDQREQGKPFVRQAGAPSFSLSHTQGRAYLATASSGEWGLDAETERPMPDLEALARSQFTASEFAAWARLARDAQVPAFFSAWTRKEAALKALGTGLLLAAAELDTGLDARACELTVVASGQAMEIRLEAGWRDGQTHLALAECKPMATARTANGESP